MSRAAQKLISASGGKAYEIKQSLLCSQADASKLRRTPSSEGNRKTFTFSTWCKRSSLGTGGSAGSDYHSLFGAFVSAGGSTDDSHYFSLNFRNDNTLTVGGWATNWRITNRTFRDCSAWYHIVLQVDTTQSTASNRIKLYVNGVEETSFSTNNNPSQNYDLAINNTVAQSISDTAYDSGTGPYHFDGYMAETHLFDGAVVAPSEFGETDSVTGQWIPKKYVGTSSYGTNGYYMPWKKNDRYSPYFTGANTTGIAVADSTDWDFGSGDFTMEAWVYRHEDLGQDGYVMGQCSSSTGANAGCSAFLLVGSNNTLYGYAFDASNTNNYVTLNGGSVADNKWYHVAMSRNGSTWKLFLDGTAVSTVTSSIAVNNVGDVFGVGKLGIYTAGHWQGWISNARVVKGTAVYTSDFTPSTTPLTAVTNTVLLCCQDKNVTTDNSGTSKSLSVTAAQTYTEQMAPFTYDWYQDQSGQDNHYQADNLTVDDVMLDTPTNNFCTLNSIQPFNTTIGVLDQGNLRVTAGTYDSGHYSNLSSTFNVPSSGKWYVECYIGISVGTGNVTVFGVTDQDIDWSGVANENLTGMDGFFTSLFGDYIKVVDSGTLGTGNTSATATSYILGMALDVDNGYAYFGVDNGSAMVWYKADGSTSGGDPTSGSTGTGGFARTFTINDTITVSVSKNAPGYTNNGSFNILNFGQNGTFCGYQSDGGNTDGNGRGSFFRAPPSGYLALCSQNLPTPTIKKSSEHFNTVLYTGDASSEGSGDEQAITGVGFQPDLVWIKTRSTTSNHLLHDVIRGATKYIQSNGNNVEGTQAEGVKSFDSDGFTVGDSNSWNQNNRTLVSWNWKAGGSGSANTDGSINTTSTSVNTTAGFSISNYQGTGSNATVGHGLGVAPKTIWIKNRDTNDNWRIYFGDNTDYMAFNWTGGGTDDNTAWNDTSPTSTVFSIGTDTNTNRSGDDFIAYCFAEVDGFSRFGTYEGNNNANGPFIHTGFRPAWIVFKYLDNNDESWWLIDNKRDSLNPNTLNLFVNLTGADYDSGGVDILSNGFKPRATNGGLNGYTGTFFYMAFAEAPFKYANAQ